MLDDAYLALVAAPIAGESPTGRSIRYDEPFTGLEMEVGKLDNPAAGEPDWKKIETTAREILGNHSKDLLVTAWAAYAALRQNRLPGLAVGLIGCRDLLNLHWQASFPVATRIKARRSALEWLGERAASVISPADAGSPEGQAALDRCLAVIDELEKLAAEKFEGEDSGLGSTRRALRDLRSPAPAAGVQPAGAPVGAAGATSTDTQAGWAPAPAGPISNRTDAIAKLSEITDFFQRTEPHSPMGFLLARAVAWNSKSFQEVMLELLRNREDAQRQVFDDLGMKLPPKK